MNMPRTHVPSLVLSTLCLLAVAVVAAAQAAGPGPGPGTEDEDTALTTFATDDFSGSGVCAACHSRLADAAGADVSNDALWRATMMANASKDPLWQAKLSSEVERNPQVREVIEDKCARCHTGMARIEAVLWGAPVEVLPPGFLDPANELHDAAMDGVSCTLCHQIQPDLLGTPDSFTGGYVIDTATEPPERLIFGPYEAPVDAVMRRRAGFTATEGDHLASSAHCATCHTLYTPVLDTGGTPLGVEFPEQTTYLEWRHAGGVQSCRDCHLPPAAGAVVISTTPPRLAAREPFARHDFVGGNSTMVELIKDHAEAVGATAEEAHFDGTLARTLDQLQSRTARVAVTPLRLEGTLELTVDVSNMAGHKVPTGLPSRRMWLHVAVVDGQGSVVFESGRVLADGRIEGNAADLAGAAAYEPHYDTIDSPDQVQIYEPVMATVDGDITYTLLLAHHYLKDNRLPPLGFDTATADDDFAVIGLAAVDDDFVGGSDRVTYEIDVAGATGVLGVTVELLFQTLSPPFVDDLLETRTELVERFGAMFDPASNVPVVLDAGSLTVE